MNEQRILSSDIMGDVMDELRRERKILMVLNDEDLAHYAKTDMTEVDMLNCTAHDGLEPELEKLVSDKLAFRERLAMRASTTKLNYIFLTLQIIFGKEATIEEPERYASKVRKIERQELRNADL